MTRVAIPAAVWKADVSAQVYRQLLENYEPAGIKWVKHVRWSGPQDVPLSAIDWSGEETWAAHHQQSRVQHFAGNHHGHPVVLIRVPGNQDDVIIDGHHRALGARDDGRPVTAYVGYVPSADPDSPWFKTHLYQIHQGADPLNKAGEDDDSRSAFILFMALNAAGKRRFLLQHRNDGMWSLPGGTALEDEQPWDAAAREAEEELGNMPSKTQPSGVWVRQLDDKIAWTYLVPTIMFMPVTEVSDETAGWAWLRRRQIADLPLAPVLDDLWPELDFNAPNLGATTTGNLAVKHDILETVPELSLEKVSFATRLPSGKLKIRLADIVKVGPEGYIHGYICVRPPCGQYSEASYDSHGGRVLHPDDGHVLGRQLKKDPGDHGYSIAYVPAGDSKRKTRMYGQYATRQDAVKASVLLHNVNVLAAEADRLGNIAVFRDLTEAKAALSDGRHDDAIQSLADASYGAKLSGDKKLQTHIDDTRVALVDGPKTVRAVVPTSSSSDTALADIPGMAEKAQEALSHVRFNDDTVPEPGERDPANIKTRAMAELARQALFNPTAMGQLGGVTIKRDLGGETAGLHYTGTGQIELARKIFERGSAEQLAFGQKTGWWVQSDAPTEAESVISHEFGHQVADTMWGSAKVPQSPKFWSGFMQVLGITTPPRGAFTLRSIPYGAVSAWLLSNAAHDSISKNVSRYSLTNPDELMAELWSEYTTSKTPRPAAKFYGDYVTSLVKNQMGVTS